MTDSDDANLESELFEGAKCRKEEADTVLIKTKGRKKSVMIDSSLFRVPSMRNQEPITIDVLILEDFDERMSYYTTSLLEKNGCILTVARNGSEGLSCLKQKPFDLLFANFSVVRLQIMMFYKHKLCVNFILILKHIIYILNFHLLLACNERS